MKKEQLEKEASFLKGWAKGKTIQFFQSVDGGAYYKCGKRMTKVLSGVPQALLDAGLAQGTTNSFTMVK